MLLIYSPSAASRGAVCHAATHAPGCPQQLWVATAENEMPTKEVGLISGWPKVY